MLDPTRAYYDEFAEAYEHHRRPNDPHGYHALIDDLEIAVVEKYARDRDLLECGCGTGLLLERFAKFAKRAEGIDLSPRMLDAARERGLIVREGSVTDLPHEDASFDVVCSFKVLAHVEDAGKALAEMARVTRPGGVMLAEFYNPVSLRWIAKRFGPAGRISRVTKEDAVYTRFDPPWVIPRIVPPGCHIETAYGVRIVTPFANALRVPVLRTILPWLERRLTHRAAMLGGFYIAVIRKH